MPSPPAIQHTPARPPPNRTPPLQSGDRLTSVEFESRYESAPGVQKAELIEGVVYMPPPPVSDEHHGDPHFVLVGLLAQYAFLTPGCRGSDNSSLRLDLDNVPQPDVFLRILETHGGQSRRDKDGYVTAAPELIAEVAASSASYDLHAKLNVYRRHAVREYIVWRAFDQKFDHFLLNEGRYDRIPLPADGVIQSRVFPGLWLDTAALLRMDEGAALNTMQRGIASQAHTEFIQKLATAKRP